MDLESVLPRKSSWAEMEGLLHKQGNPSWVVTEDGVPGDTWAPWRAAEKRVNHFEFSASLEGENPNS